MVMYLQEEAAFPVMLVEAAPVREELLKNITLSFPSAFSSL